VVSVLYDKAGVFRVVMVWGMKMILCSVPVRCLEVVWKVLIEYKK
jgi:hypothetical protein